MNFRRGWLCSVVWACLVAANDGAAVPASMEPAVPLPPFLVEAKGVSRPWRYARSPEFEILSRVPDATTVEIARSYHRLHRLLAFVLPERFQVTFDVPKTLILYDQSLLPTTAAAIFATANPADTSSIGRPTLGNRFTIVRNPRMSDLDAMTVFASVPSPASSSKTGRPEDPESWYMSPPGNEPGWTSLTPDYVGELMGKRTPPLPAWFTAGFTGLYRRMHFSGNAIELGAVFWLSETETRGLRKHGAAPPMLPLREFFAGTDGDLRKHDLWFAEAELFVRWALDDRKGERREAFWKFLDRCCTEPASEALFRECFAADYDRGDRWLEQYLRIAVMKPATLQVPESGKLQSLPLRDATAGEISRIKGDWERIAAHYVQAQLPALEQLYVEQSRQTLHRAYDRGDRDPALLAALGLFECDSDNAAAAREYLEAAMRGGAVRPRAYLELARLRLAEQGAHLPGPDAKLNVTQTAGVLAPLLIARHQAPPLANAYELIAEVWLNSEVPLQPSDLSTLDEGIRFFPRDAELIFRAAQLHFARGFSAEAAKLADAGMGVAPNDEMRERFAKLRTAIGPVPAAP